MRILIDADDVLWDLLDHWVEEINKKFNLNVSVNDCTCWEIGKLFPTLTIPQIFSVLETNTFWDDVRPIKDAPKYVKKLVDENYDVVIVTSSTFGQIKEKFDKTFSKYFGFFPTDNIIICKRKQLIKGDFLVDDYVNNLIGGDYAGILFTSYHNKDLDESKYGLCRCNSWEEVYNLIKESSRD